VSARIVASIVAELGTVPANAALTESEQRLGAGVGVIEGWRGATCWRVELDRDARIGRVKIVDPSFFNWPALPIALADTIVPDFPLTNKSFNQSYAGNDL